MKLKSSHLLCQHLENISRKALENYPDLIKDFVKNRHGIYALYHKNRLYYVGLARNLRIRLSHHLRDRHAETWDRFSVYLTIGDNHLREIESLLLRIASPKGNKITGKLRNSRDMKPEFSRKIKEYQRKEWKSILEPDDIKPRKVIFKPVKSIKKLGRTPVLAKYIKQRIHIRMDYKGKRYIAHVRRDGTIAFAANSAEAKRLQGKIYTSPSMAACAVAKKRSMDGWFWWKYERAPGDWGRLNEMRK